LGSTIAPYIGKAIIAAGFVYMGYKLFKFWGGSDTAAWKKKGIVLPVQYALNFYPPNPVDPSGDPLNLGGAPRSWVSYEDEAVIWQPSGSGKQYKEPIGEFIDRTGRVPMPTAPLVEVAHEENYGTLFDDPELSEYMGLGTGSYDTFSEEDQRYRDLLAFGLVLGLDREVLEDLNIKAVKAERTHFFDSIMIDDEGILFFDQGTAGDGGFHRVYYAEQDTEELIQGYLDEWVASGVGEVA